MSASQNPPEPTPGLQETLPDGRAEYLMSKDEFGEFVDACNPPRLLVTNDPNYTRRRSMERAGEFWKKLGATYGFDPRTVSPVEGKHHGYFTALPVDDVSPGEPQ